MTTLYANAKLVKDFRIDVDDSRCHAICLDQPLDTGTDMGPSALELCVMSLAGCYASIFILTIKKMRLQLADMEVKMEATKSEKVGTVTEVRADITVKIDAREDRVQRAHKLTLDSCPVGILFDKAGVRATYNLKIEKP